MCHTQGFPATSPIRCLNLSPADALVDLTVGGRLRIAVLPQRRTACRGDARGLAVLTDVVENFSDLRALGDEGDQTHLPTAH